MKNIKLIPLLLLFVFSSCENNNAFTVLKDYFTTFNFPLTQDLPEIPFIIAKPLDAFKGVSLNLDLISKLKESSKLNVLDDRIKNIKLESCSFTLKSALDGSENGKSISSLSFLDSYKVYFEAKGLEKIEVATYTKTNNVAVEKVLNLKVTGVPLDNYIKGENLTVSAYYEVNKNVYKVNLNFAMNFKMQLNLDKKK